MPPEKYSSSTRLKGKAVMPTYTQLLPSNGLGWVLGG